AAEQGRPGRSCPAGEGSRHGRAFPPASSTAPGLATACCDPCRRAECAARTRRVVGRVRDKRSREGGPPDHLPGGPAGAGAAAAAPTAAAGLSRPRAVPTLAYRPGPPPLRGPRAGFARTRTAGGVRRGGPAPGTGQAALGGDAASHRPAIGAAAHASLLPVP